jgi:DNA-binding protein HU-beta
MSKYFSNFAAFFGFLKRILTNIYMTKAQLITEIAISTGFDKTTISTIVESYMSQVKKCMSNGENVYLRGFGTFELKARKEKVARNITRRSTVIVPAHSVPVFKPAKEFKSVVENAKPAGKRARKK